MKPEYEVWVATYEETNPSTYSKCKEAVEELVKAFPELRAVAGHVETVGWGRREHWWAETTEGEIIDPTVSQFPGVWEYEEWLPGRLARTGRCMNCGDYIWKPVQSLAECQNYDCACSPECEAALRDSIVR